MQNATVLDLKKAIRRFMELKQQREGGVKHVSWRYVWRTYQLVFQGEKLEDDKTRLKDYGIRNRDEVTFMKRLRKKWNVTVSHIRKRNTTFCTVYWCCLTDLKLFSQNIHDCMTYFVSSVLCTLKTELLLKEASCKYDICFTASVQWFYIDCISANIKTYKIILLLFLCVYVLLVSQQAHTVTFSREGSCNLTIWIFPGIGEHYMPLLV